MLYLEKNYKRRTDSFAENKTMLLTDMFPFIMQILSEKFRKVEKRSEALSRSGKRSIQSNKHIEPPRFCRTMPHDSDFRIAENNLNPQAHVAQKIADEVVFRRFQGEGVEFF